MSMMRPRRLSWILAGVLVATAAPSLADPEPPELDLGLEVLVADDDEPAEPAAEPARPARDAQAARLLADGAGKFVKKAERAARRRRDAEAQADYERALQAYDRSFELHPDARVLVAAAEVAVRLGRWVDAVLRYQRALAEDELPLDDRSRARAQAALDEATLRVGLVTLHVEPEGAVVSLDGVELGTTPLGRALVLAAGDYALAIQADGHLPIEVRLVVEEGSESERAFELAAIPVVVEAPRPPPPPPPPPPLPPPPGKPPLYAGAGATVLLVGAAVTTGALALGKHGTFRDAEASADERAAAQASGRRLARLSDVATAGAVVAGGLTAYYYLKVYRPRLDQRRRLEDEQGRVHDEYAGRSRRPKLIVAPSVQADGGGLVLAGWF
jgi:hypothetical protein